MIFPVLELEKTVQIGDRTRLNAVKSYATKGSLATITKVEIEPYSGAGFIDVTGTGSPLKPSEWYTDYQYDTDGDKTVTIKINGDTTPITQTAVITVLDEVDDALFAADTDLTMEEPDVLKYVKAGRNSFKDVHREVQTQLLDLLNRKGYRTTDGQPITKDVVVDHTQVREIAKYLALAIIFNGLSNQVGDIFSQKTAFYQSKYGEATQRQILGLDLNKDGTVEANEGVNIYSAKLVRR